MKIFNWVHKRFHHNVDHSSSTISLKDGLSRNVKKIEPVTNDAETQALLQHVALVDVLDGWKDGVLTIGTFGFDPLKHFNQQKECLFTDKEEEEEEEEEEDDDDDDDDEYTVNDKEDEDYVEDEEELNPLVFTAFRHGFEKGIDSRRNANASKADLIMTVDGIPLSPFVGSTEINVASDNAESDPRKKKGERTTLADLFSADSEVEKKPDTGEVETEIGKKPALRTKTGLSFAKKLIPRVGEDSRPIRKLHRLMTRMLKRKIHPELEAKIHKSDDQINPSSVLGLLTTDQYGANELVSLLQTQDVIV